MKIFVCSFVLSGAGVAGVELVLASSKADALSIMDSVLKSRGHLTTSPELWEAHEP